MQRSALGRCRCRCLVGVASIIVMLSACTSSTLGNSVDTSLTTQIAQTRVLEYFTETLAALPAQTTLSLQNSTAGKGQFYTGDTVPCDDSDQTDTGPLNLQLRYWVHGVPIGQQIAYFDLIVSVLDVQNWSPRRDIKGNDRIVRASTSDGYTIIAHLNSDDELSLGVSSPCFPRANDHSILSQPTMIAHP